MAEKRLESENQTQPRLLQGIKAFGFWLGLAMLLILMIGGLRGLHSATQTYHFTFGLAKNGVGQLADDWFANTQNPWIVFQWIVQFTDRFLGDAFFYIYQIALVMVYLYALVGIADHFFHIRRDRRVFFIFLAFYLASYAYFWPDMLGHHIYAGVATMYMPFDVLIPNSFAAFLFLSIYFFFKEKPAASILAILAACYVHPSYLIVGAALVSGYLLVMFLDGKNLKQLALFGGATFMLVLPVVAYFYSINLNATAEQIQAATNITAGFMLPHHTQVAVWWDHYVVVKLLIVLAAMVAARKNRLFYILLVGLAFVAVPTIVLAIRPSNTLGALMLWRPAVVIVPVATTILIAAWVSQMYTHNQAEIEQRWGWVLVGLIVLVLLTLSSGIAFQFEKIEIVQTRRAFPVYEFIREDLEPGDQYMIVPDKKPASTFRLETGAPTFVTINQHPWGALDALEWYHRIQLADTFYQADRDERCQMLPDLVDEYGITHVLTLTPDKLRCPGWALAYTDDEYTIFARTDAQP